MTQKLVPEVIERMQPLWAVADEVLRSDLGLLIEVARRCNGDKTVLSTVEFERAGRDFPCAMPRVCGTAPLPRG